MNTTVLPGKPAAGTTGWRRLVRWRPGPLLQMTLALVSICGMLLVLADLLLGVFHDPDEDRLRVRKQIGEAMAVQVAALLKGGELKAMQQTLSDVVQRTPDVRSVGLRRADGLLVLKAGEHEAAWVAEDRGGASTADRIEVPMHADGRRWGGFEIAFQAEALPLWRQWTRHPLLATMAFVFCTGLLVFSLYMRRALQHLDPSGVIPDRVQGAFDTLAEGVAVLDGRGRVLLVNRAFRGLNRLSAQVQPGQVLSGLQWLTDGLGQTASAHPWMRAMAESRALFGQTVDVEVPAADEGATGADNAPLSQHLVVNAAPILDAGGRVRGCLATFTDQTALQRANLAYRRAVADLNASREEVQRKNDELTRLATRDPLTGCFNRRAFNESYEHLFNSARIAGLALSCMVLDIDFFKKVNDTHGHSIGDRVIVEVAKVLQAQSRPSDLVCRYGGEEFVVVLPGLDETRAAGVAERIRVAIEAQCGPAVREVPGMTITVSIGVASISGEVRTPLELVDLGDAALYAAKKTGRTRVCVHSAALQLMAEAALQP